MSASTPHYLLCCEASRKDDSGRWRFVVRTADGSKQFEAADAEPKVRGDRLDLLTVVRGLEALDQPSRVTLIGCSPYVRQGMQYGLSEWRDNGWRWEFFGQMVPVKNGDLWQRMDRALRFHQVDCRQRRFDPPQELLRGPKAGGVAKNGESSRISGIRVVLRGRLRYQVWRVPANCRRPIAAVLRLWRRAMQTRKARMACSRAG